MFKVNEYFGGNVKSLAFATAESPATIGLMAPGTYEFGTSSIEIMKIISGKMKVKLPGESDYKLYIENDAFTVAANVKFQLIVEETCAYLCLYK
jgi:purine/pyrimidine-nucleoside phosphorylase